MAKTTLFDDDDSGSDNGFAETARGQELKINQEYARRFEHNKKRAEIHRRKLLTSPSFSFTHIRCAVLKIFFKSSRGKVQTQGS